MSDRTNFPSEAMRLLEAIEANTGGSSINTDDLEAIMQDVDDNTDNIEPLLNNVISELQDVESDAESINSLLDELEDALQSTGTDEIRVNVIDEGDIATEATLSSVNDFLDAIEDALASVASDELRVEVTNEPISIDDNNSSITIDTDDGPINTAGGLDFEVDTDNSTSTPLSGGAEFIGDWEPWGQYVGLGITLLSDVTGGSNDDGDNSLTIEISDDGGTTVTRSIDIDYPPNPDTGGPDGGIEPFIPREGTHYRVRYQNGDDAQSTFALTSTKLSTPVQSKLLPIEDTVIGRSSGLLVKSVLSAQQPDNEYKNVGADRFGNLRTSIDAVGRDAYRYAPRGDVTLYGSQVIGSKVPQIDIQWHEEPSAEDVLNTDSGNTGTYTQQDGAGVFNSGTGADDQYIAHTFDAIEYISGFEIQAALTISWNQPPTNTDDYATSGLSDGDDGVELGFKGTDFGIRFLKGGTEEQFVTQDQFNIDKLDGNPTSEYRRDGEPVAIDVTTQNVWRIRFGWYGTAPTHVEVLAPDGHWVAAHKFDFTTQSFPQTTQPNLPIRVNLDKNSSDSTNLEISSGAWYGGITANVAVSQQPDGDYVSEKASGQAFSTNELLTADEEFVSDWMDTDGWASIEVQVDSDQPSADNGLIIEFTNDVQDKNPTVDATIDFQFTQANVDQEDALIAIVPSELDGFRTRYINGDIGQNEFLLTATLRTDARQQAATLREPISGSALAQNVKNSPIAKDDAGEYADILRDGDALRVAIDDANIQIEDKPDNTFEVNQVDIPDSDGGGPISVLDPSLSGRTKIRISNDGDGAVFMGEDNSVSPISGYRIEAGDEEIFPLDETPSVWMIAEDGVGGTDSYTLNPASGSISGTATNPGNVETSNNSRAIYDTQNENIDASGYDASSVQQRDNVSLVEIGFEGRRDTGGSQTITYEQTASAIQEGGTSITTNQTVISNVDDFYVATVATRNQDTDVTSITGLGLTWSQQAQISYASGGVRHETWIGEGTPTGNDTVTANFSQAATVSAIGVSRLSGVDSNSPVKSIDTDSDSGSPWSISPTPNSAGDFIVGGAVADTTAGSSPTSGDTEREELQNSGPNMTFAVHTDDVTGTDEELNGNWGFFSDWAGSAIALNASPLPDPEFVLEYEVSSEGVGSTTLIDSVSETTDTDFTTDVTGDRSWSYTDIDNITLSLEVTNVDAGDLEVDHIFVSFTEADAGDTQRVSFMETGIQ